jgi:hypothetical protein
LLENPANPVPARLLGGVYHHPFCIAPKIGAENVKNIFFRQCLATAGTDKQQHIDGKPDGKFSLEKRLSFVNQLRKKLVNN